MATASAPPLLAPSTHRDPPPHPTTVSCFEEITDSFMLQVLTTPNCGHLSNNDSDAGTDPDMPGFTPKSNYDTDSDFSNEFNEDRHDIFCVFAAKKKKCANKPCWLPEASTPKGTKTATLRCCATSPTQDCAATQPAQGAASVPIPVQCGRPEAHQQASHLALARQSCAHHPSAPLRRKSLSLQGDLGAALSRAVLTTPSLCYKSVTSASCDHGNISHDPTRDPSRDPSAIRTSRDLSAHDPGNLRPHDPGKITHDLSRNWSSTTSHDKTRFGRTSNPLINMWQIVGTINKTRLLNNQ